MSFADGSTVQVEVDPHLQVGFPVQSYDASGSYHAGPVIHTLVGDIDGDLEGEILTTGLAGGPLYAWNADGTPVPGWPVFDAYGAAYPGLGELDPLAPGLEVFSGLFSSKLIGYRGDGQILPGWPRDAANYVTAPPTLADIDGDGVDEIFIAEEDFAMHAYTAVGALLPGWPVRGGGSQGYHTPAVADLDGDGDLEVVFTTGWATGGANLHAVHHDGTAVTGFPLVFNTDADSFPVIGDVDGDGAPEIVVNARLPGGDGVLIVAGDGTIEHSLIATDDVGWGSAVALADLDNDVVPEIIMQSDIAIDVWKGDGTALPGWPVMLPGGSTLGNTAPVIGDVDGDGAPEVVVVAASFGGNTGGQLLIYNADGLLNEAYRKSLASLGSGAAPAIADIDGDGRNEVIVTGAYWDGVPGYHDKVWVYDFGGGQHGAIHWGQFMGAASHRGVYRQSEISPALYRLSASARGGSVTSSPAGIDCGSDCAEVYAAGTVVTLTATPDTGLNFLDWGGACAGQGNPCTVVMDGNLQVSARFDLRYTVTLNKYGLGQGSVVSEPVGIDCGADCSERFIVGDAVVLTAQAAPGSAFVGWRDACSGTDISCTVTVDSDVTVGAVFEPFYDLSVTVSNTSASSGYVVVNPGNTYCYDSCTTQYAGGTEVTLSANAYSGSKFAGWEGPCAGQGRICTITIDQPTQVTARFDTRAPLAVTLAGNGSGHVGSVPLGIDCGTDCDEIYDIGTQVILTATEAPGSMFTGWTGACSHTSDRCYVTVDFAKSVTATFTQVSTVTVTRDGTAYTYVVSDPAGISCTGASCSERFPTGSTVTLNAIDVIDSVFDRWGGDCTGQGNPCVLPLDGDKSVTVKFLPRYRLEVFNQTGNGSVSSDPAGIDCGSDCSEYYLVDTPIRLTAHPAPGYAFAGWRMYHTVGFTCEGQATPCTFSMNGYKHTAAYFAPAADLTLDFGGNGTGTVKISPTGESCGASCARAVATGSPVTLTAVPAAGARFGGWRGACAKQDNPCVITPTGDTAVTVNFR